MSMIQHNFTQGSPEWMQYRAEHFNASDAAAMLGCSPYKTRDDLLREMATGETKPVDAATQRRFDDGHRFEALARVKAEQIVGEDLYPVVGSEGRLSASFDGLTLMGETIWEHKTINDTLRGITDGAALPEYYRAQMEQQLMLSGADKVLFSATRWKDDELQEEMHVWYMPDFTMRGRLLQGWAQFAIDLASYTVPDKKVEAVGEKPSALPVLFVEVAGTLVTTDNIKEFRAGAEKLIAGIKTELKTDQDFADAEQMVKHLDEAEKRIDLLKDQMLSKTGDLNQILVTLEDIQQNLMRNTRLKLSKQVEAQKVNRRNQIVADAEKEFKTFLAGINAEFAPAVSITTVKPDFYLAIKGKRSFEMMVSSCNDLTAKSKIEANEIAAKVRGNLALLAEQKEYDFLFPNKQQLASMERDHLALVVTSKIEEYKVAEQKKRDAEIERQRAAAEQKRLDEEAQQQREDARQKLAAQPEPLKAAAPAQQEEKPVVYPPSAIRAAAPAPTTEAVGTIKRRPTSAQIIETLCDHYHANEATVTTWLREMNLERAA
jgi:putative phage-type endonuclease